MGRTTRSRRLNVWMNGEKVGARTKSASGEHVFADHPDWLRSPLARPISLSMPLHPAEVPYRGPGVVAFFGNLLPDSPEIRRRMQARYGAAGAKAFPLLEEIGRDCVGALQLLPPDADPGNVQTIKGAPLGEKDVAALLRTAHVTPLAGIPDSGEFRLTLAGFQAKTALLFHKGRWHLPKVDAHHPYPQSAHGGQGGCRSGRPLRLGGKRMAAQPHPKWTLRNDFEKGAVY